MGYPATATNPHNYSLSLTDAAIVSAVMGSSRMKFF
jgi:hypothetical protein